jgi:4-hydroxy-tetrahydrodipicolinate reductase
VTERIRVGVLGARGRMGSETCRAVERDPELDLVARVESGDERPLVVERGAQVAVDFTTPTAVVGNVRFCVEHGVDVVVGTTGLSHGDLKDIDEWAARRGAGVVVAPNFAVGAVLMMRFAAQAAPYFAAAEIVERHHERKLDAPSGTARRTAEVMGSARTRPWGGEAGGGSAAAASRGTEAAGVRIHSLRLPGSVAHQEVVLGAPGETLTIRHDSVDRSSFMPGVLLAIKRVGSLDGLTVGLERLLDL